MPLLAIKSRFSHFPFSIFPFLFIFICVYPCSSVVSSSAQGQAEHYRRLREEMVRTQIAPRRWTGADAVRDPRVLDAMRKVPRHLFVPLESVAEAYDDHPLPIGHGQTISQPYIVARMTELAQPRKEHRALEVGTGSGYQAAVLAELVAEVCTIEIVAPLGLEAKERLRALGYRNVEVRVGDGYAGWPEKAPFDIILVTAAAPHIPPPLIEQLKPGGRMVIPVGEVGAVQTLMLITKGDKGPRDIRTREIIPVQFVPLTRTPKKQ